jgi:hypothetical protein
MIPSLIFLLLRRYHRRHPEAARRLRGHLRFAARLALVLLLTAGIACYAFAQERVLQYAVKRNGNPVGTLALTESKGGNRIVYKLQSVIKTSFLCTIAAKGVEEAVYENGVLVQSFFYQKVNGNERVNTRMQAAGNGYTVVSHSKTKSLRRYPITYNMVCLYTLEPLHRTTVFSDRFQEFLPVETLRPHQYKVTFPDGAYSEYRYQNGLCTNIKIHGTLFSAEMSLKN